MPSSMAIVLNSAVKQPLLFYLFLYNVDLFRADVHVPEQTGKRIDYRDYGLSHLFFLHAVGRPQRAFRIRRPCVLNELRN